MKMMAWVAAALLAAGVVSGASAEERGKGGDPEAGKTVARQCVACHNLDKPEAKPTGPSLLGVWGRPAGTEPTYAAKYGPGIKESGIVWDNEEILDKYLENPQSVIKGSRMAFRLSDPKKRADVIAYLKTLK
jgi:cytochrome c